MGERDHGGGLDAAMARWGGAQSDWLDLSTGINPVPYPLSDFTVSDWSALPDKAAEAALISAARSFWNVPDGADILAAPGASALIARMPSVLAKTLAKPTGDASVSIPQPTYNEHAAAFQTQGWQMSESADLRVLVHPNNPTGKFWTHEALGDGLCVIDESFCDVTPEKSFVAQGPRPDRVILKSFGKFWGLAGLRLGFVIAAPELVAQMRDLIGPWAVSGPALRIATDALNDPNWADETRQRLAKDSERMDRLMQATGAQIAGGCDLFRLYELPDARPAQDYFARHHILTRIFPYSQTFIRLGLPAPDRWDQFETALKGAPWISR